MIYSLLVSLFFFISAVIGRRSNNWVICIIGTNRTGKTSELKKIIRSWRKNNSKGVVWGYDPQSKMKEYCHKFIYDSDKDFAKKLFFTNENAIEEGQKYSPTWKISDGCLLVLDDHRLIHHNPVAEEWLRVLMNFREDWNLDIVFVMHTPTQLINYVAGYANYYYLFYTKSSPSAFKDKIPDYDLCIKASSIVELYVKNNGRGEYPKFPYCIVDTQSDKIRIINFDKNKWESISKESRDIAMKANYKNTR